MFKRIFVEDWAQIIPVISFCIFAAVFLLVSIRAMLLRRPERERMAAMPLDLERTEERHCQSIPQTTRPS